MKPCIHAVTIFILTTYFFSQGSLTSHSLGHENKFTASYFNSTHVKFDWSLKPSKSGKLAYKLIYYSTGEEGELNIDESTGPPYILPIRAYQCQPVTINLIPIIDNIEQEPITTSFIFPIEPNNIVKVWKQIHNHTNHVTVKWEVEDRAKYCQQQFVFRVNDEDSIEIHTKEYTIHDIIPKKLYNVHVKTVFKSSKEHVFSFFGTYGGIAPTTPDFSLTAQVNKIKVNIDKPLFSDTTPVDSYVIDWKSYYIGVRRRKTVQKRIAALSNYSACVIVEVRVSQITKDGLHSSFCSKDIQALPYTPNQPKLDYTVTDQLLSLTWTEKQHPGNKLCDIKYNLEIKNQQKQIHEINSTKQKVELKLNEFDEGEYSFRVRTIVQDDVIGEFSNPIHYAVSVPKKSTQTPKIPNSPISSSTTTTTTTTSLVPSANSSGTHTNKSRNNSPSRQAKSTSRTITPVTETNSTEAQNYTTNSKSKNAAVKLPNYLFVRNFIGLPSIILVILQTFLII